MIKAGAVATTFLFPTPLNEHCCPCLVLDEQAGVIHPFQIRNFAEIHPLQLNNRTVVVLPSHQFSLHYVKLPRLHEKKLRTMLLYAIEEQLAQNIEELHVAFNQHFYYQGQYLVAICDKSYLKKVIDHLTEKQLKIQAITIDWFGLKPNEVAVFHHEMLFFNETLCGALPYALGATYFKQLGKNNTIYWFKDSQDIPYKDNACHAAVVFCEEYSAVWVAKKLAENHYIDLCQGEFKHQVTTRHWYYGAALLFVIWIVTMISIDLFKIHRHNEEIKKLDQQIASIFHRFLPTEQSVISPRFRITKLLASDSGSHNTAFWMLLNALIEVGKLDVHMTKQLNWGGNALKITVVINDFKSLETLKNRLQHANIHVKQLEASTQGRQVMSVLELRL